jgi:hypothetical protein
MGYKHGLLLKIQNGSCQSLSTSITLIVCDIVWNVTKTPYGFDVLDGFRFEHFA